MKTELIVWRENMKTVCHCLIGLSWLTAQPLWAGTAPRGTLLELHSCELYAGGCVVSSEATQKGHYMLRAWSFTDGRFANENLAGLRLAVLETSPDNLAAENTTGDQAVVYLPQEATPPQREALVAWLRANAPEVKHAAVKSRTVAIALRQSHSGYAFSAGRFVSVQTAPLESCAAGSCGEGLWYKPRMTTSTFAVAMDRTSQVQEPWLKLKWIDAGKRSVFLAKFGEPGSDKDVYVTCADLCGAGMGQF